MSRVALALAALAVGLTACGGGETTIIKETTTVTGTDETDPDTVYMMTPYSQEFSEPSEFQFSVNGDMVARDLDWSDWGSETATATGRMDMRDYPSNRRVVVSGTVVVSDPEECEDRTYYTDVSVDVPPDAPFQPATSGLGTPCG